ncbi:hypothetical protein OUZ56_023019 [Daphnia magna]|uniref:Uncharacterized protein n=1 Tax=Daphnia magna TaxID=35525 RepID=A0ABR0AYA4_9CRUS|nr:hypothetical protein OUZ56_023019 [Daphnia magna]
MRKWAEGMDGQDLSSKNDGMSYANWIAIYTPSVAEASYAQCLIIINTVHSRDDCRLISRSTDDCHIVLWLPPGGCWVIARADVRGAARFISSSSRDSV